MQFIVYKTTLKRVKIFLEIFLEIYVCQKRSELGLSSEMTLETNEQHFLKSF